MKKHIKSLAILVIVTICILLVGCNASVEDSMESSPSLNEGEEAGAVVNGEINRKIVYTVSVTLEASDVSEVKNDISSKNSEFGGYVQDTSENYSDGECTYVYITYRVPTEHLDEFLSSVEGSGDIIKKNVKTTDITTQYVSAESKKNALMERRELLEEMLDDDISASEKLSIINEISDVSGEIQSIELMINGYDSSVNYSTVSITIRSAETFFEKMIPFLNALLILTIYIGIPVLIFLLVKKRIKKKEQKK